VNGMDITIRLEEPADYRRVEEVQRDAFWDHHAPGCDEHYLAHCMRSHPDFIPELDFVALVDGEIVGNIMYAKAALQNEQGERIPIVSFGPVGTRKSFQRKGVGTALIRHSLQKARDMGYPMVVIYGYPHDYCKHGFVGSKSLGISDTEGRFPVALLAYDLTGNWKVDGNWKYITSDIYLFDSDAAQAFDATFPPREKGYHTSQEEFRIACQAYVD